MSAPHFKPEDCEISFRYYINEHAEPAGLLHRTVVVDGVEFSAEGCNLDDARKAGNLRVATEDEAWGVVFHGAGVDLCGRCMTGALAMQESQMDVKEASDDEAGTGGN